MSSDEVPPQLVKLAEKIRDEYRTSEFDIAKALAEAGGPLTIDELAEATGYTERTIKKRVGTLEEALGGEPLIRRDDDDRPILHDLLAAAVRDLSS